MTILAPDHPASNLHGRWKALFCLASDGSLGAVQSLAYEPIGGGNPALSAKAIHGSLTCRSRTPGRLASIWRRPAHRFPLRGCPKQSISQLLTTHRVIRILAPLSVWPPDASYPNTPLRKPRQGIPRSPPSRQTVERSSKGLRRPGKRRQRGGLLFDTSEIIVKANDLR